jgi:hypothetical protein
MTGVNVILAIWAVIGMFGLIGMVRLVEAPEVWKELAESEQAGLAQFAGVPRWLRYGMLGSLMVKATLYCVAAFGYFTRSAGWGRGGGTALAGWILLEQVVLVVTIGQVSIGVLFAVGYAVLTLWVIHFGARDAFDK